MDKTDKSGRCGQVIMTFWTRFGWLLVVVDRWSLFRGSFSTIFAWADLRVVVIDRWSLFGGGCYRRFDCTCQMRLTTRFIFILHKRFYNDKILRLLNTPLFLTLNHSHTKVILCLFKGYLNLVVLTSGFAFRWRHKDIVFLQITTFPQGRKATSSGWFLTVVNM